MQLLINFIGVFFDLMSFAILARVLLSWVNSPGAGRIKMIINDVTDPILTPFQRPIFRVGMMDLSPIVALITLDIVKSILLAIVSRIYF
jgi:YggT family protein